MTQSLPIESEVRSPVETSAVSSAQKPSGGQSMVNKLGQTLALQAVGVIAMALVNVIIAQRYGPVGQGYLSYYRSTVLFAVQIGLIGLPQALVYMLNSGTMSRAWAVRFSTYYGLLFTLVVVAVFAVGHLVAGDTLFGFGRLASAAIVLAAAGALLHELYRAVSLATKPVLTFNLVSIFPALLAIVLFALWHATDFHQLVLVLVIAYAISSLLALIILGVNPISLEGLSLEESAAKLRFSFTFGFFSAVPGTLFHLLAVLTYAYLRASSPDAAGQFSVALLLLTFTLLPLERAAPLLFDTWSKKESGKTDRRGSFAALAHLGSLIAVVACAGVLTLATPVIGLVFGEQFLPAVLPTQVLILSIYVFYHSRLLSTLLLSLGQPRVNTIAAGIRGVVILGVLFFAHLDSILNAAVAWAVGEAVAMVFMVVCVRRLTGWPLAETLGVSPKWIGKMANQSP